MDSAEVIVSAAYVAMSWAHLKLLKKKKKYKEKKVVSLNMTISRK